MLPRTQNSAEVKAEYTGKVCWRVERKHLDIPDQTSHDTPVSQQVNYQVQIVVSKWAAPGGSLKENNDGKGRLSSKILLAKKHIKAIIPAYKVARIWHSFLPVN